MLSKEEISKLKINVFNQCDDETIRLVAEMLKHIEQLESDKQELTKKLNETIKIKQTADSINFSLPIEVVKEIDKSLSKTNIALENKRLKLREQKLIEKLENDVINITKTMQDGKHYDDYSKCRLKAYRTKTKEILKILKGEKE